MPSTYQRWNLQTSQRWSPSYCSQCLMSATTRWLNSSTHWNSVQWRHFFLFLVLPHWLCSFFLCTRAQTCYICEDQGRESKAATGACMTCNKHGCRQAFHVTWWDALTWHQPRGDKDAACSFMSAVSLGLAEENWVLSVKSNLPPLPSPAGGKPGTSSRHHKLSFPSCFDKITYFKLLLLL